MMSPSFHSSISSFKVKNTFERFVSRCRFFIFCGINFNILDTSFHLAQKTVVGVSDTIVVKVERELKSKFQSFQLSLKCATKQADRLSAIVKAKHRI